jgi:hypothetical protein
VAAARTEEGTGLISTIAGFTLFLALLFTAAHLLVHLYARSVVTAAAFDAARIASGAATAEGATGAARQHVENLLGDFASDVEVQVWLNADEARVRVVAESPTLNWPGMTMIGADRFVRDVSVRRERFIDD